MEQKTRKGSSRLFLHSVFFVGGLMTIWSSAAILSGLAQVGWDVSELLRQYLVAAGVMQEHHTFVDFYTHIKGVEYIICAAFLSAFPAFFRYLDRTKVGAEAA
ncbi:MAG: hypothetical protein AB1634_17575 [Thermodesulfobacteriota bacterium]